MKSTMKKININGTQVEVWSCRSRRMEHYLKIGAFIFTALVLGATSVGLTVLLIRNLF